jgi:hypothetical protein
MMQATPPIGAVLGGALLARGELTATIAGMAGIIAVPGAISLLLPALGRRATVPRRARTWFRATDACSFTRMRRQPRLEARPVGVRGIGDRSTLDSICLLGIPNDDNSSFMKGAAEAPALIRRE